MSIDLSVSVGSGSTSTNNRSQSKRQKNLFDERSTSRERILTRKQDSNTQNQRQQTHGLNQVNSKLNNINKQNILRVDLGDNDQNKIQEVIYEEEERKSFNTNEDEVQQEEIEQSQGTSNNQILKNFPFLQLQQQMNSLPYGENKKNKKKHQRQDGGGGMNEEIQTSDDDDDDDDDDDIQQQNFNLQMRGSQYQQDFRSKDQAQYQQQQIQLGNNFFDGIDIMSQSQSIISVSPQPRDTINTQKEQQYRLKQAASENFDEEEQDSFVEPLMVQQNFKTNNNEKNRNQNKANSISQIDGQNIVHSNLHLNLSGMGSAKQNLTNEKSFLTAKGSSQNRFGFKRESDSEFKSALGYSNNKRDSYFTAKDLIASNQDEFISANDQTINLNADDEARNLQSISPLKTDHSFNQLIQDIQLSRIENRQDERQTHINLFTTDNDIGTGHLDIPLIKSEKDNQHYSQGSIQIRKEERVKTQITQHILDQLMYEVVIPQELRDLAQETILNLSTQNKSENSNKNNNTQNQKQKQKETQLQIDPIHLALDSETIYNSLILPSTLIYCLQEFFTVTDNSVSSQKALRKYLEEDLIENVNFNLCSEIWNDCLLLPHLMREDPQICLDSILSELVLEVAEESVRDMRYRERLSQNKQLNQSLNLIKDHLSQSYLKTLSPRYSQNASQISFENSQAMIEEQQTDKIDTQSLNQQRTLVAIEMYIEENLINDCVNNQVEDLVINVMQDIIYKHKKLPKIISEQISNQMIDQQTQDIASSLLSKERQLSKGADNFLYLFINQELEQVLIECIEEVQDQPQKISEDIVSVLMEQVTSEIIKGACVKAELEKAQSLYTNDFIDLLMDRFLTQIANQQIQSLQQDTLIVQACSDAIQNEVIYNSLSDIILESVQQENLLKTCTDKLIFNSLKLQLEEIVNECVVEDTARENFEYMIDKLIENDIWRETVKDLRQEEDAIFIVLEEWADNFTREFFLEHFGEIKDEYLRNFKEQMVRVENSKVNNYSQSGYKQQEFIILSSAQKEQALRLQEQNYDSEVDEEEDQYSDNMVVMKDDPFSSVNQSRIGMGGSQTPLEMSQNMIRVHNRSQIKVQSGFPPNSFRQDGQSQSSYRFGGTARNNSSRGRVDTSKYLSVRSEVFYDCQDQEDLQEQQMLIGQLKFKDDTPKNKELMQSQIKEDYQFKDQESSQIQNMKQNQREISSTQQNADKQQNAADMQKSFDTQYELMNETMQNLDIDEGTKRIPTIRSYYVIPEIKSLDFLNIKQQNFNNYFKNNSTKDVQPKQKIINKVTVLPIDAYAIDALCVNCYECVKFDLVDDHSEMCLKIQSQKTMSQNHGPKKIQSILEGKYQSDRKQKNIKVNNNQSFNEPVDLNLLLNQDRFESNINLDNSYNFQEGRYILNESGKNMNGDTKKAKEEMQFISELNERIFKIHKSLNSRIQEEQQYSINDNREELISQMDLIINYAIGIFTNNTDRRDLETTGSQLIASINQFKPKSAKDLGLQITYKRLQQLTIEKIQSLATYQELMGIQEQDLYEVFSHIEDGNIDNDASFQQNDPKQNFVNITEFINTFLQAPSRSFSQSPLTFTQQQKANFMFQSPQPKYQNQSREQDLMFSEQFKQLDEEEKKNKAELEIWRNLHNEILKNYLMSKGPINANRQQIHEISSDVSSSKNDMISDNTSSYSSQTGASSVNGSQFYNNFRQSVQHTPRLNLVEGQAQMIDHLSFSPQYNNGSVNLESQSQSLRMREGNNFEILRSQQVHSSQEYISTPQKDQLNYAQQQQQTQIPEQTSLSNQILTREEQKRQFYTMAIQNAKKILKIVPQSSILRELYKKSQLYNLQTRDWESFIQDELRSQQKNQLEQQSLKMK